MESIKIIMEVIKEHDELVSQEELLREKMKRVINDIDISEYQTLDYQTCKLILDKYSYRIKDELKLQLKDIMVNKKEELYPELLKAHYYPELNTLDISDRTKMEIDDFIRKHTRYHLNDDRLIPSVVDNINKLIEMKIIQKNYSVLCPNCGSSSTCLSQEEFNNLKRVWELEANHNKTIEEKDELECLYEKDGFGVICVNCFDCDDVEEEISNLDDFNKRLKNGLIKVYYTIVKNPDLTYEKL